MKKKFPALFLATMILFNSASMISASDSTVQYTANVEKAIAGERFDVTIAFNDISDAVCYAVMVDDNVLSASGISFVESVEIGENKAALFAPDPNDPNDVAAAYGNPVLLHGDYVRYTFEVPETAAEGSEISISFRTVVYDANNKEISHTDVETLTLIVEKPVPAFVKGDIDLSGFVDIADAMLLFQHSMVPAFYPIEYTGRIDLNLDGALDIADAMLLFQYSMLPDLFPIPD